MMPWLITVWFQWLHDWGYVGIAVLMAMESSIIPVPSELVIPPAAYWAAQGRYTIWGVVLAGTIGSYLGATATYWAARWIGRPLILRYGAYLLLTETKLLQAERWLGRYEAGGVFFARLFPVVRHLIGIPAGIVQMDFRSYSMMTLIGSTLWCSILAWFGLRVLGDQPQLLDDPVQMIHLLKARSLWFIGLVLILCVSYFTFLKVTEKPSRSHIP
jgi:membrane protein DedA with SNARE-associated domain